MKKILIFLTVLMLSTPSYAATAEKNKTDVVLNTKTLIYHSPQCHHAQRCNKNCVSSTLEQAVAQGARACKACEKKINQAPQ